MLNYLIGFVSSIRWRLSLLLSAVIFVSTVVCVVTAVAFLRQALTDRATSDLQRTLNGATGYLAQEERRLRGAAALVSANPGIGSSLKTRQQLIARLTPYFNDLNVDSLQVVDRAGRVVATMEDTTTYGYSVRQMTDVQEALQGRAWVGLDRSSAVQATASGWAIRASSPLRDSSGIIGAVVVGRQLDSAFAAELGHVLNADVNIIVGTRRTGSTETDRIGIPMVGMTEPAPLLARLATGHTTIANVDENGRSVLSGLVPLGNGAGRGIGAIEVVRPLGPLYDVITHLSLLLIVLGIAIVIAGTLFALYVGGRFTRRLRVLEDVASQVVAHPEDAGPLHPRHGTVPVQGRDEVASLARSFNSMMTTLDERMATIERLYSASQTRVRELSGLAEVARLLTTALTIKETLDSLSRQVCRLVGCKAAAIYVPSDDSATVLFGAYGLPEGYAALIGGAIGVPAAEDSPLASQAAYWSGAVTYRQIGVQGDRVANLVVTLDPSEWGGATAIPLRLQNRTIGVLACYTADRAPLPESDVSLLTTIADQVAVAVENARLYMQAQEMAALEERSRLSRELHDSVSQVLYSIGLATKTALALLDQDPARALEPLEFAMTQTERGLAEMRALIFDLRPEALEQEGLAAALGRQIAALQARHDLDIEMSQYEEPDAPVPVKEALYRIAQEALHNTVKHAAASRVRLSLTCTEEEIVLEIRDNGKGFDTAGSFPGHLGLHSMRDRATRLGGMLELESAVGEGTVIRVHLPQQSVAAASSSALR